jgi:rhodanese-related sulfurtransferase
MASAARLAVLIVTPAICAFAHYLIANRSAHVATHFVPAATQSAQASPTVADKATIALEDFERIVAGRSATIIDAREPNEFATGHVPGARNFYVNAVEADVSILTSQIDPMTEVVLYCEGSTCEDSSRLFDIMTQLLGYANVRLFRGGMIAWEAARLPLEKGRSQSR